MMVVGILVATVVALACGVGLGSIPVVNENLHWNVWAVVPISGVLVGAGLGCLQFGILRGFGQPVRASIAALLALACVAGYASTEVGIYSSTNIEVADVEGIPDGSYPLIELMSFSDYLTAALSSSSYEMNRGGGALEYGSNATKITWAIDLAGAFLGGLVALLGLAMSHPFCERCTVYKRANHKLTLSLGADEAVEVLDGIHERVNEGDYAATVTFLNESTKLEEADAKDQYFIIKAVERICPTCKEATLIGTVSRRGSTSWEEVGELAFRLDSGVGDGTRLG